MSVQRSEAETAYLEAFAEAGEVLPAADWLEPARQAARDSFAETGLPHRRDEAWRWTDLRTILDQGFPPALSGTGESLSDGTAGSPFTTLERHVITFVDGHLRADLSDFDGLCGEAECVRIDEGLSDAPDWLRQHFGKAFPDERDTVSALNTVFLTGGIAISVPAGAKIGKPLELLFVNTGTEPRTLNTKCLVVLGDGAEIILLETHLGHGDSRYVANSWTELFLGKGASAGHVKVQNEAAGAVHLANTHAVIGGDATLKTLCLSAGAQTTRNQIKVRLDGEGGHIGIAGAYLLSDRQHCDTALMVDHAVPECTSGELFKCVMDDHARGIFQGKIIVRPDAQKTDGMQMTQGLLLSETAEFDAKPELEIFADDVRCTHGATSGELDEDLMFYLRSRGIPADEAKSLLIAAFIGEAVEEVEHEQIRELLNAYVAELRNGAGVEA
jgi:Fe-S cluster assembly protein SufD